MTKTQDIFHTTAGAIKHVDYTSRKCAHFATGISECVMWNLYIIQECIRAGNLSKSKFKTGRNLLPVLKVKKITHTVHAACID